MPKLFGRMLLAGALSGAATANAANAGLTAIMADRMAQACFGYAKAHRAAVNIWIYNPDGEVIRFERMDGAPAIGSPPGIAAGATPFGAAIDPNSLATADPGDVAITVGRQNLGRVRVAGMGAAGNRACAEAAVGAAK